MSEPKPKVKPEPEAEDHPMDFSAVEHMGKPRPFSSVAEALVLQNEQTKTQRSEP